MLLRRDDVVFGFDPPEGCDAVTAKLPAAPRYEIEVDTGMRRTERAFTMAHELAHIDLDNFIAGRARWAAEHPDDYAALEAETDRRARELFDVESCPPCNADG